MYYNKAMTKQQKRIVQVRNFIGRVPFDEIVSKYPNDTRLLLENKIDYLKDEYPETVKNLNSCKYNADRRTIYEYGQDLAIAWVVEDFAIMLLERWLGYKVEHNGGDYDRRIKSKVGIKGDSDFIMYYEGKEVNIEFVTDYSGYMARNKSMTLRDRKFRNLKMSSKRKPTLIFGIDLVNSLFILFNIDDVVSYREVKRFNKPSIEIDIPTPFLPISKYNIQFYGKHVLDKAVGRK